MPAFGFLVTLEPQPGKEEAVAAFLRDAKTLVDAEPGTLQWYAFRLDDGSFGIFDTFDSEDDRTTHLHGEVRKALEARGPAMLATEPKIRPLTLIATKP